MKTLRLFGLTLMAILLSVNFSSCSKDDDPVENPDKLVGEWILTLEKSWGIEEGRKFSNEASYDINKPEEGSEKYIIKEGNGKGEFVISMYGYYEYNDEWEFNGKMNVRLDGNKIIPIDGSDYDDEDLVKSEFTYSLKDNKLTLKAYAKYVDDDEYNDEMTFQKK